MRLKAITVKNNLASNRGSDRAVKKLQKKARMQLQIHSKASLNLSRSQAIPMAPLGFDAPPLPNWSSTAESSTAESSTTKSSTADLAKAIKKNARPELAEHF